ncbi:hypothetical protein LXL04_039572 [Taraxacum kok-saghyz]
MMAVVPTSLMQRYENYPLVDKLYSIKHFKLMWDPFGCPKFEGYIFLYDDYAINVSETTRFTLLEDNNFPFYPLVHTIETLVRIPRRRLLIDVVGKVISWRLLGFNCVFELLLQDHSGFVIKLILNDGPGRLPVVLARAFIGQWVMYVSHVKYREWEGNFEIDNGDLTQESIAKKERKRISNQEYWRTHGGQNKKQKVVSYDVVQDRKEKRKEVNQRYHAKKKDKQLIETEPLQNIDNQPRQRTIRNANNASTSRGIGPIDKENISPHSSGNVSHVQNDFSKDCNKMSERNKQRGKNKILFPTGVTIEEPNDARDYEVGNNEEASITGEHHFTNDEENTEICSAITYETQTDVRDDTEVHLNPINEDDPYDFVYDRTPVVHRVLAGRTECNHCGAIKFKSEFVTFCCMNGKTKLASTHIPPELFHLFTSQDEIGHMFRDNIRAYNTNFSFTSMGVTLDNDLSNKKSGVYTFRAHGGIYHRIDQLVPRDGKPRYLQLYFYDSETEFTHRLKWANLDKTIIRYLTASLVGP